MKKNRVSANNVVEGTLTVFNSLKKYDFTGLRIQYIHMILPSENGQVHHLGLKF